MADGPGSGTGGAKQAEQRFGVSTPPLSMPKGGGAIRGIGEKFAANPVTGTGSMSVPLLTSPGRSGFGPQLLLSYDSAYGNGPFGFGWSLSRPAITRKTDKGLPQYRDAEESDVYVLSGTEDLVPVLQSDGTRFEDKATAPGFAIHRYRPRIEGLFARIERWTNRATGEIHWRSISRDNIKTHYGKTEKSRIADPSDPKRVFTWLICESYDDKGNAIVYEYAQENEESIDQSAVNERNRIRTTNRYLKRIKYGNRVSRLTQPELSLAEWMFEVVFDYDEGHYEELDLDPLRPEAEQHRLVRASASRGRPWMVRPDPFSSHRAAFEMRTYRRCRRILMFHRFVELGAEPYLVRATEFDYADLDYSRPSTVEDELGHQGSTRFASFICAVTQSGFVRDDTQAVLNMDGVKYVTYIKKSFPPLDFEYSKASIQDDIRELDASSLENLPVGLDGTAYQWVDLDGEGVSGILTEQADAWFYKPSLGEGRFGPVQTVAAKPSLANLSGGRQQLLDLAGDGQLDLIALADPAPGFYERTQDENWEPFKAFRHLPNIPWDEPNLRFVDLNGDGHADVLITEDEVFVWHESFAEEGFGPARQVRQSGDEEVGPRLVFADGMQSIYLADMCGDGLTDLVRIRNGEICYWPNQGYGRFGPKVTMDNSPCFDQPDQFNQRRIRLADIDGSGTNDIIYLGRDDVRLYFNQSGNRLSESRRVMQFPHADNLASVTAVDLLGNGTACLVWSSPLLGDARRPMRYIDLMGGEKPHLLIKSANNLGAETRVQYAASTKFYLADKLAGKPWITRIPFPVHVVERVETHDHISGNQFVTRSSYHHGYFDGIEREFHGFGMVEQWDTEEFAALNTNQQLPVGTNVDASSHVPPVLTRTWFHTGVYLGRDHVSDFFAGLLDAKDVGEYYHEPGLNPEQARQLLLDDTVLPDGLTIEEEREACRALKGSMLRQEIYAVDGSAKEKYPYAVTEQNFTVKRLQEKGDNRHAVFFTHAREAISYHYERRLVPVLSGKIVDEVTARTNPDVKWLPDPRVAHTLTLEVDGFGNVLKSAAVGYGRRLADISLSPDDQAKQTQIFITYTENRVTNAIEGADDNRAPLLCEARTSELTGLTLPVGRSRFTWAEMLTAGTAAAPLAYEERPSLGVLQKRLIEQVRTIYRRNDLTRALPLGELQSLALPFESCKLAFTPGLLTGVYGGRVTNAMLAAEGRYAHSEADANWWISSAQMFFSPESTDTPAQELAYARQHFFIPHRYRDPFHTNLITTETFVTYDGYDLLMVETRDALGNRVTAGERTLAEVVDPARPGNDYRVLQPRLIMDPNRNRSAIAFDALGMVVGTAVMGKPLPAPVEGDSLAEFEADLTEAVVLGHLANPLADPKSILRRASTRLAYDLFAYRRTKEKPDPQPAVVYTQARETHDSDPVPTSGLKIQHSFSYSDGFGREIQEKIQAEAGPVPKRDESGKIIVGADGQHVMTLTDVSPRWVGSGWTVFNNKGKPVCQYEPFFTDTHRFEFDVRIGVSPVLFYDPVERVVATLHPDHTWEKVVFDPWRQESWDGSDTALVADPKTDPDVSEFFSRLPDATYVPTWHAQRESGALGTQEQGAARKAAIHAATPAVAHADSLGRVFLTVAHNRFKYRDAPATDPPVEEFHSTRVNLDIEGNQREVVDAKDRVVMRYDYDALGNRIHQASMEAGERWMLNDVAGKPLYAWDSRSHQFRTAYDALRRPTDSFLREGAGAELLEGRILYGETRANPEDNNLRGKAVQILDQAGIVTSDEYDFKGNLLRSQRKLAQEYKSHLDWSADVPLESDIFASSTRYDALNRPTEFTTPHTPTMKSSVVRQAYSEANLLERVEANLCGAVVATNFVTDIDYDAKGQRTLIDYGNGVTTTYTYDPLTFRLIHLQTRRKVPSFDATDRPGELQNLHYTYDPVGNITHIRDEAQQTIYFRNKSVEPRADYTYDAIYRLIEASGREYLGKVGAAPSPSRYNDMPRVGVLFSTSDNAMGLYLQRYVYDLVGNFVEMIHRGSDPVNPGWTRTYAYEEPSQPDGGNRSNRLTSTTTDATTEVYSTLSDGVRDGYDAHGNMLHMPQLQIMQWDFKDQLQMTQRQAVNPDEEDGVARRGERTWYVYDAGGQRVRKVTELPAAGREDPRRKDERIYLGDFEIHRGYDGLGNTVKLERETLHMMDDKRRIALVETKTVDVGEPVLSVSPVVRYQLDNHLGSSYIELDDEAALISYEEYYPYGSTSYQAGRSVAEVSLKRYRYTGKERDEESGLYYHEARYYAPWFGRWTSCDPLESPNPYDYGKENPINLVDPSGNEDIPWYERAVYAADRYFATPVLKATSVAGRVAVEYLVVPSVELVFGGSSANAPTSATDETYARETYTEQGAKIVITMTGAAIFKTVAGPIVARTGSKILGGIAGGATSGAVVAPANVAVSDVARGKASPALTYVKAAVTGAATGAILGGAGAALEPVPKSAARGTSASEVPAGAESVPKAAAVATPESPPSPGPSMSPVDVKPDVYTHELFRSKTMGPAHGSSSRGYDRRSLVHQKVLERARRWWGGPGPVPELEGLDLGHSGTPFSRLRPGQPTTLKAQASSENRSIGAGPEKAERRIFVEKSRQLGLNPHDPSNPYYVRPSTKR
jgi:RHS repeat-associated protein